MNKTPNRQNIKKKMLLHNILYDSVEFWFGTDFILNVWPPSYSREFNRMLVRSRKYGEALVQENKYVILVIPDLINTCAPINKNYYPYKFI